MSTTAAATTTTSKVVYQCTLPPAPISTTEPSLPFMQKTLPDRRISFSCPADYFPFGNLEIGGPQMYEIYSEYVCNPVDGNFVQGTMLSTLTCAKGPSNSPDHSCGIIFPPSTASHLIVNNQGTDLC
ncbi:hypothetical protein PMAYCL1PPCAC_09020 [Pristionchus mayeri]|uniref:Uncharacterized protein n=1 Tax=Pristionchus mayeri TaxID=1317129 RepID=A0AAN5CBY2_9BILA|nr:hypothetical protein PMAYCL1PPCAC_09020 [Pristionchus mayeri]